MPPSREGTREPVTPISQQQMLPAWRSRKQKKPLSGFHSTEPPHWPTAAGQVLWELLLASA